MIRWAVLVSGEGTNLQNFLDMEKAAFKSQQIVWVGANRDCRALARARASEKPTEVISFAEGKRGETLLLQKLRSANVDRVFLLGFMKILSADFLEQWARPIVNLHPSLLPAYKGKDAIKRAWDAREPVVGVSLHEVVSEVDAGRILRQQSFAPDFAMSFEDHKTLVHKAEQKLVRDFLFDLEIEEAARVALGS